MKHRRHRLKSKRRKADPSAPSQSRRWKRLCPRIRKCSGKFDRFTSQITVSDRDAQPLVRIPQLCPRAEEVWAFGKFVQWSPKVRPFIVVAKKTYCTESCRTTDAVKVGAKVKI